MSGMVNNAGLLCERSGVQEFGGWEIWEVFPFGYVICVKFELAVR